MESHAQPAKLQRDGPDPEIPAATDRAEKLRKAADQLMARIADLPIERLAEESEQTIVAVRELLTGPEIKDTLASIQGAAKDLRAIGSSLEGRTDKLFGNLIVASNAARQAAEDATRTIAALDGAVGAKSLLWGDLERMLGELTGLLRSLRQFTEHLERHPEALIQGKSGDG
jgi:paraquat-inducible protein B